LLEKRKGKNKNIYDTFKLPRGITLKIDEMIELSNQDFTSRTDVIKTAIRLMYTDMKK
jgi:Arc/MetJ-type ribon-helix-helix transcriptional regulator